MQNKYVIDHLSLDVLRQGYLLVDTNFIIDASSFNDEVERLMIELSELGCQLTTVRAIVTEFLGGTKDQSYLHDKVTLLEQLFNKTVEAIADSPLERKLFDLEDVVNFSRQCNKFSATDFELYLTLKKYRDTGMLLLTRNHHDFTNKLFRREGFITLLGSKEIRTYGLYAAK